MILVPAFILHLEYVEGTSKGDLSVNVLLSR